MTAIASQKFAFAKLFKTEGADVDAVLEKYAGVYKNLLKKNNACLDDWYELLPRMRELGTKHNRLKEFAHILDVKLDMDSFQGEGVSKANKNIPPKILKKNRYKLPNLLNSLLPQNLRVGHVNSSGVTFTVDV